MPSPWKARSTSMVISSASSVGYGYGPRTTIDSLCAKPQPSPKTAMHAHPKMNVSFRPNRSASLPRNSNRHPYPALCVSSCKQRGTRALRTELREYAEMIHCSLSSTMFRSLPIVGSETETAVKFAVYWP